MHGAVTETDGDPEVSGALGRVHDEPISAQVNCGSPAGGSIATPTPSISREWVWEAPGSTVWLTSFGGVPLRGRPG
ncbi:hypothetical protein GCM10010207_16580 [Streptomyces atratus]|nr:hypothetical protein GCM10010207_16580 [Streptomyces atratus]